MPRIAPAAAFLVVAGMALGALAGPVSATGVTTVTITDSSIDVKKGVAAWQDIVSASVSESSSARFEFSLTVGAAVPRAPALSNGTVLEECWFCLQVNSSFTVGGWPAGSGNGTGNSDPCQ